MVSWFIMPWEAARVSMEAQRMIAAQFFGFAFPGSQAEDARHGEKNSERTSDRDNNSVNCQDPISASQPTRKAVAARSSAHVTKRTTATRRRKSRAGKGKGAR